MIRLYHFLDGDGVSPEGWIISRMCEEFPCYGPPQAIEALENDATGLHLAIIAMRAFARTKQAYEDAQEADRNADADAPRRSHVERLEPSEMLTLVQKIDMGKVDIKEPTETPDA